MHFLYEWTIKEMVRKAVSQPSNEIMHFLYEWTIKEMISKAVSQSNKPRTNCVGV